MIVGVYNRRLSKQVDETLIYNLKHHWFIASWFWEHSYTIYRLSEQACFLILRPESFCCTCYIVLILSLTMFILCGGGSKEEKCHEFVIIIIINHLTRHAFVMVVL